MLTFDTEDFISVNSVTVLRRILESLQKYNLKALFFVTGHMAERLKDFPATVTLLSEHQVGYHSSSHSVHPTILEFTDIPDYDKACQISIQRETAHINPLTGKIEGSGGILALGELFPRKRITAFRAPGHCWSPPHLEALKGLGIKYDFSTSVSSTTVDYKDVTFYPYPILAHWQGKLKERWLVLNSLVRHKLSVMAVHPSLLINKNEWDLIYRGSNPRKLTDPQPRSEIEFASLYHSFDLLLRHINSLQKRHLIRVTADLEGSTKALNIEKIDVEKCYLESIKWAVRQGYRPKFQLRHFQRFFKST
jgi:hypothetical protein